MASGKERYQERRKAQENRSKMFKAYLGDIKTAEKDFETAKGALDDKTQGLLHEIDLFSQAFLGEVNSEFDNWQRVDPGFVRMGAALFTVCEDAQWDIPKDAKRDIKKGLAIGFFDAFESDKFDINIFDTNHKIILKFEYKAKIEDPKILRTEILTCEVYSELVNETEGPNKIEFNITLSVNIKGRSEKRKDHDADIYNDSKRLMLKIDPIDHAITCIGNEEDMGFLSLFFEL